MERARRDGPDAERDLDEERIAGSDQRCQIVRSIAVAGIDEAGLRAVEPDSNRVTVLGVGDAPRLDGERSDPPAVDAHPHVDCLDVEGLGGEARPRVERIDPFRKPTGRHDANVPRRVELVSEVMPEWNEIN